MSTWLFWHVMLGITRSKVFFSNKLKWLQDFISTKTKRSHSEGQIHIPMSWLLSKEGGLQCGDDSMGVSSWRRFCLCCCLLFDTCSVISLPGNSSVMICMNLHHLKVVVRKLSWHSRTNHASYWTKQVNGSLGECSSIPNMGWIFLQENWLPLRLVFFFFVPKFHRGKGNLW